MHEHVSNRLTRIDALRGVAILLVLAFHYYSAWSAILPYGERFAAFPPFRMGLFGVYLFFMISGFVILMTLERSAGFVSFIMRRWIRLFPAMLAISLFIYFTAPLFPERPAGAPSTLDLIPGLLFIEPSWLIFWTGLDMRSLELAFWSLYAEVRFYILFAALYFALGQKVAVRMLLILSLTGLALRIAGWVLPLPMAATSAIELANDIFNLTNLPWFLVGILSYQLWKTGELPQWRRADMLYYGAIVLPALVSERRKLPFVACILAAFLIGVFSKKGAFLFGNRALLWLGAASYPLYLVHERLGLAIIIKASRAIPELPDILLPLVASACVMFLAFGVARWVEAPAQAFLRRRLSN